MFMQIIDTEDNSTVAIDMDAIVAIRENTSGTTVYFSTTVGYNYGGEAINYIRTPFTMKEWQTAIESGKEVKNVENGNG